MTNAVENESASQSPSASEKSGASTIQTIVIGILILGAVALIAYQIFGCSGCYG